MNTFQRSFLELLCREDVLWAPTIELILLQVGFESALNVMNYVCSFVKPQDPKSKGLGLTRKFNVPSMVLLSSSTRLYFSDQTVSLVCKSTPLLKAIKDCRTLCPTI